ncbi:MAG: glucosaminidase [Gammaproteobacteria bacterium]|nr:glucosaminidase [Gammaproteobacteria bacterium]
MFGSTTEAISVARGHRWWGSEVPGQQLSVPRVLNTGIAQRWRTESAGLPVSDKKELFFRILLPLVLHANEMVVDRRAHMTRMREVAQAGSPLSSDDAATLARIAAILRLIDGEKELPSAPAEVVRIIDAALYRLDVIPAGLVLAQGAIESGYGSSRFAIEGNALFGQWTFGGVGMVPQQQRRQLGDHRIATFDWVFDGVRAYFLNLSSNAAYEELRRLRAALKAAGQPPTSVELADGLIRYSERGQVYVDEVKAMIRRNDLSLADNAVLRDEPVRFLVGAESPADAERLRVEIAEMRDSGELAEIVKRMQLE